MAMRHPNVRTVPMDYQLVPPLAGCCYAYYNLTLFDPPDRFWTKDMSESRACLAFMHV